MSNTPPKPGPGALTRLALARAERHGWGPVTVEAITGAPEVYGEADMAKTRHLPALPAATAPTPPPPAAPVPVDPQLVAALAAASHAAALHRDVDLRTQQWTAEQAPARPRRRDSTLWRIGAAVLLLWGPMALVLVVFAVQIMTGQIPATPPPLVQTTTVPATPAD